MRLELSLDCPYVAAKSLQALNQAYVFMHARNQEGAVHMQVIVDKKRLHTALPWLAVRQFAFEASLSETVIHCSENAGAKL